MKQFSSSTFIILFIVCFSRMSFAQVAIGTGTTAPNPDTNAVLLLEGNGSQGIIIPKVNSLGTFGKPGMIVYNTATGTVHYFNTAWVQVGSGGAGSQGIQIVGNKVLIGTGAGFTSEFSIANTVPTIQGQILMWDTSLNSGAGGWTSSANTAPSTIGQVLKWNGSRWEPGTDNTGSTALPLGQIFIGNSSNVATASAPSAIALNNLGAPTADVAFGNRKITNLAAPTLASDAATKAYVDGITPTVADNSITGGSLGAGVKIAANTITNANISTLAAIAGSKINPDFVAQNILTTGTLTTGTAGAFAIDATGNITKIRNVTTSFPVAQGVVNTYLRNDGSGNLSWSPVAGGSDVTAQSGVLIGNGSTITGLATGANNQVLTVNAGVPTWQNIPILNQNTTGTAATATALATGRTITLTGDVGFISPSFDGTGNISANATVVGLRGRTIANTLPVDGQVLKWNNTLSQWEPAADAVGGGGAPTLTPGQIIVGDGTTNSAALIGLDAQLNSTNGNVTVRGLQGRPISIAVPLSNSVYQFDGTQWAPVILAGLTNPMTAPNDLIVGGAAGAVSRLAAPGNNQLLGSNGSGAVTWIPETNFVAGGSQASNLVLASPNGSAGLPIYRQVVDADIAGTIAGSKIVPNFVAQNILTTGTLTTGTAGAFSVDATGNITKIRNATTSFPAANAAGVLTNNGTGTLTWSAGGSGWGLTGNAGTVPATNFIGTTDAQDLVFRTNNTEYARITSSGKVGFGTTTPLGFLEVNSLDNLSSFSAVQNGATGSAIFAQVNSASGSGAAINVNQNGTGFGITSLVNNPSNTNSAIIATHNGSGSVILARTTGTGSAASLEINNAANSATALTVTTVGTGHAATFIGGNVGIGTITPISKLDVSGDVRLDPITAPGLTTNKLYNVGGSLFWNGTNISSGGSGWGLTGNTLAGTERIGSDNAQPLAFETTNIERMRISATGNVGIATTTPQSPLQIGNLLGFVDDVPNGQNIIVRGLYSDGTDLRNIGATSSSALLLGNERTGLYTFPAGAANAIAASPSMRFNVRPSGVGIQVDNPIETFQVNGATYLNPITAPGVTTDRLYNVGGSLFWNGTNISSGGSGWGLGGTLGTLDGIPGTGTNYIGTRDNVPLNLIVNNQRAGRIEAAAGTANSFYGYQSGNVNTGTFNAAFGYSAMTVNTTGQGNAAVGYRALANNSAGNSNTAMGFSSLSTNTTGNTNTAIGSEALRSVAIGGDNTAVGQQALRNATGNANVGIGSQAAITLTTGNDNAALGSGALFSTTTGSTNTAVGNASLSNNITGSGNTALGYNAEVATGALTNATAIGANASVTTSNTIQLGDAAVTAVNVGTGTTAKLVAGQLQITGGTLGANRVLTSDALGNATWQPAAGGGWGLTGNAATVDGTNFIGTTDNIPFNIRVNNQKAGRIEGATPFGTFYGYQAGQNNGAAQANVAIGYQALTGVTSASNTAIGYQTLQNTNGGQNTAVGSSALTAASSGAGNTALGQAALANATTANFNTAVGLLAMQFTTGGNNAALGSNAGQFNSSGQTNVFVGFQAGFPNATVANSNTTGSDNTFVGANTGLGSSTQRTNATAIGANARVDADNTIQLGNATLTTVNVGTGTTAKLVAGQLQVTGGTLGLGRVLTSDAAGNATWQPGSNATSGNGITVSGSTIDLGGNMTNSITTFQGTANNMFEIQSSAAALGTKAGIHFKMFQSAINTQYEIFTRKMDAIANSGNSDLVMTKVFSTAGGYLDAFTIENGTSNVIINNGKTTASPYGDFIVANGRVGIGTSTPAQALDVTGYVRVAAGAGATNEGILLATPAAGFATITAGGRATSEFRLIQSNNAPMTFQTNNTERMRIDGAGNVGIGTSPSHPLHVAVPTAGTFAARIDQNTGTGDGELIYVNTVSAARTLLSVQSNVSGLVVLGNGFTGIGRTPTTNQLEISGNASKAAAGGWLANSDRRIKTDIRDIDNSLELIKKIRPVKYKYTAEWMKKNPSIKDHYYYSFVAQEYQQVFPEAVQGSGEYLKGDKEEILQIDTHNAQMVTIKAVQEQQKIIESQQEEIASLKKELGEIKSYLGMEAKVSKKKKNKK